MKIRNLMTNPWPTNTNGWTTDGRDSSIELRMTQASDAIYTNIKSIANVNANDLYICLQLPHISAGEYVFGANITERSSFRSNKLRVVDREGWKEIKSSSGSNNSIGYITLPFTLTHDKGIQVRIQCGNTPGSTVFANEFLLMTQEDWDTMRSIKSLDDTLMQIRWFAPPKDANSDDVTIDPGGALLALAAIIRIGWWRHERDESDIDSMLVESARQTGSRRDSMGAESIGWRPCRRLDPIGYVQHENRSTTVPGLNGARARHDNPCTGEARLSGELHLPFGAFPNRSTMRKRRIPGQTVGAHARRGNGRSIQTRPICGMVPGSSETVDHLHLEVAA